MDKKRMIWIANWAVDKGLRFEELKYSDYMYGYEKLTEDVWDFVIECNEIGTIAFNEKYKEYLK